MTVQAKTWAAQYSKGMNQVGDVFRRFIPKKEGESLDEQIFPWNIEGLKKQMQEPVELHKSDPSTNSNIIQMMAVEKQHWMDYISHAKYVTDKDLKELLIKLARAEEIHHFTLMSLLPKPHDASEAVLSAEIALLSGYSQMIDNEPNDMVKDAFTLMFNDHLLHAEYAAGIIRKLGCDPGTFTSGADLGGGKSLNSQFMKPEDTVWQGKYDGIYDKNNVDPMTLINVDMSNACEIAAWDGYSCAIENTDDQGIRLQYGAFQSIEGQHATIAASMKDPSETPLERALVHEAVEISNYSMKMNHEPDARVKKVFQELYQEDMEHARLLGEFAG